MTEDIAAKIRERVGDWVLNCLDPQGPAQAILSVLDFCALMDRESVGSGRFADSIRERIADELGISVSPLRGPSDQSEVDDDPGWLDRDTEFDRTRDAQTGYEGR